MNVSIMLALYITASVMIGLGVALWEDYNNVTKLKWYPHPGLVICMAIVWAATWPIWCIVIGINVGYTQAMLKITGLKLEDLH